MKDKLHTIVADYRKSSWRLIAFTIGLFGFAILAAKLPTSTDGEHFTDFVMFMLLAVLMWLWFSDSRRRYRTNRDTLYGLLLLVVYTLVSLVALAANGGHLYTYTNLPNGGFEVTLSGLSMLPLFLIAYLIALPLERYLARKQKPIKGIESKKIFK